MAKVVDPKCGGHMQGIGTKGFALYAARQPQYNALQSDRLDNGVSPIRQCVEVKAVDLQESEGFLLLFLELRQFRERLGRLLRPEDRIVGMAQTIKGKGHRGSVKTLEGTGEDDVHTGGPDEFSPIVDGGRAAGKPFAQVLDQLLFELVVAQLSCDTDGRHQKVEFPRRITVTLPHGIQRLDPFRHIGIAGREVPLGEHQFGIEPVLTIGVRGLGQRLAGLKKLVPVAFGILHLQQALLRLQLEREHRKPVGRVGLGSHQRLCIANHPFAGPALGRR